MEAMVGASIAALTIYDMCKAASHDIVVKEIKLMEKTGESVISADKHRHPELAKPLMGKFGRNEWAILGMNCSSIRGSCR
jgi:hypothetical protein